MYYKKVPLLSPGVESLMSGSSHFGSYVPLQLGTLIQGTT